MLSSPGTLQIATITRSAVCNSSLAPDKKRVVGGFCFRGGGVRTSQGLPMRSAFVCLDRRVSKTFKTASDGQKEDLTLFCFSGHRCKLPPASWCWGVRSPSPPSQPQRSTEQPVRGAASARWCVRRVCPEAATSHGAGQWSVHSGAGHWSVQAAA